MLRLLQGKAYLMQSVSELRLAAVHAGCSTARQLGAAWVLHGTRFKLFLITCSLLPENGSDEKSAEQIESDWLLKTEFEEHVCQCCWQKSCGESCPRLLLQMNGIDDICRVAHLNYLEAAALVTIKMLSMPHKAPFSFVFAAGSCSSTQATSSRRALHQNAMVVTMMCQGLTKP